jgi:hypothetical protein
MRSIQIFSYFPIRLALYALIEALTLHGIVISIAAGNVGLFAEDGVTEWIQFSLMFGAGCLFFWNWRQNSHSPPLLLCSMLAFVAALRELDHYSEIVLFEDAYKYPVALIAFCAIYVLWKHWKTLGRDLDAFAKEPAFFFLAFGSFLTAILAQVFGQVELWHSLIEGPAARTVKRIIEESLETIGYMTLFLGALESLAFAASKHGAREPAAPGKT